MSKLGDKVEQLVLDIDLFFSTRRDRGIALIGFLEDLLLVIAGLSLILTPVLLPIALLKYLFS